MNFLENPIVEICLSLIVTWALFAVACSFTHEIIAEILAERGKFLKRKLYDQLQDRPNGVNWAASLYMHGTVDLLSRAENKPTSYIPPKLFAEALIEVVAGAQIVKNMIDHIPADEDQDGQRQSVDEAQIRVSSAYQNIPYKNPVLKNFKAATIGLPPSDVMTLFRQSLTSAELRASSGSEAEVYQGLVNNLCEWYAFFSERVNLWYKKITRTRLFIIGLIIASAFQIDTIQLFKYYRENPETRKSLITEFERKLDDLEQNFLSDSIVQQQDFSDKIEKLKVLKNEITVLKASLALPIGWDSHVINQDTDWLLKILGLIITAFAGSFGAPFWFDLFRRITNRNRKI